MSYQLAPLGADVIKNERRGGEDMRRTPLSREWAERPLLPAGRRSTATSAARRFDLQKGVITIVKRPAAQADVVMENFRPGVMDKLALAMLRCRRSTRG